MRNLGIVFWVAVYSLLFASVALVLLDIPAVADDVYAECAAPGCRPIDLIDLGELSAELKDKVTAYLSRLEGRFQALAGTDISPFEADRLNCRFAVAVENALGSYYAYHDLILPSPEVGLAVLVEEGFLPYMVPNAYFPNERIPMKVLTATDLKPTYEPGTIIYVPIVNGLTEDGDEFVDPGWLILTGKITSMIRKWEMDLNIRPNFNLPENTIWIGYIGTES